LPCLVPWQPSANMCQTHARDCCSCSPPAVPSPPTAVMDVAPQPLPRCSCRARGAVTLSALKSGRFSKKKQICSCMCGSSSPWHDSGWVISCWTKMILERTGYASCPSWYFIHRGCKQDHRVGQTKGPLFCCPVSGGDTVQEQELSPCTSSQPGSLGPTQLTYTMSALPPETFGMSQEESIPTGW